MSTNDWSEGSMTGGRGADPVTSTIAPGGAAYGKGVASAAPIVGGFVGFGIKAADFGKDGADAGEITAITADATGLVMGCAGTTVSIATDPLDWLVGQGLNFLIAVVTPLKEAIQLVAGDAGALKSAAEKFNQVGQNMEAMAHEMARSANEGLAGWRGEAGKAASDRIGEFASGIAGTAGDAGQLAMILQVSAMVIQIVEEFITGLLTELVKWLIVTWLAALAAAPFTGGASTAPAAANTSIQSGRAIARATEKLRKLAQLSQRMQQLLTRLQGLLKNSTMFEKFIGESGMAGKMLAKDGLAGNMLGKEGALVESAKKAVGLDATNLSPDPDHPMKVRNFSKTASMAGEYLGKGATYGATGNREAKGATEEKLDI